MKPELFNVRLPIQNLCVSLTASKILSLGKMKVNLLLPSLIRYL